jgi:hypothetical protein
LYSLFGLPGMLNRIIIIFPILYSLITANFCLFQFPYSASLKDSVHLADTLHNFQKNYHNHVVKEPIFFSSFI